MNAFLAASTYISLISASYALDLTKNVHIDDYSSRDRSKPFFFYLHSGSDTYRFTADLESEFYVARESKSSSLEFSVPAETPANKKEKIFLSIVDHKGSDHWTLNDGKIHHISLEFQISENYENPASWLIHLQAWQCCGGHPPFSIRTAPSQDKAGPVQMYIDTRDDDVEMNEKVKDLNVAGRVLGKFPVIRGRWNHLALVLEPSSDESATPSRVTVILNNQIIVDAENHWGYDQRTKSNVTKTNMTTNIGVDIGIYRRKDASKQVISFRNIIAND